MIRRAGLRLGIPLTIVTLTLACTAPPATERPAVPQEVPQPVYLAAVATIDAVNAAADSPSSQRRVLTERTSPLRRKEFDTCAVSTTTIRFEPVWSDLRASPSGDPQQWLLPTLIRIFRDGRAVGTDVTALALTFADGSMQLPPLCVR